MSTSITFNGVTYTVPAIADASWGTNVGNYLIAIASGCLQKTGGAFTLSTADVDFGGTYGLKAVYFKSKTTNIASAGVLALAKTDAVVWRNNANGADLSLGINGSDALTFNSIVIADASSTLTLTNKLLSDSTVKFANVSDATKLLKFSLGGATTAKTMTIVSSHTVDRTITIPDATDTIQLVALAQSPTNKTFDSTSTMTGVKIASFTPDSTHTLTCPTSTDTLMGKATTDTMTNKTATAMAVTGGSFIDFLTQAAARFNDDSGGDYVAVKAPTGVTTHTLLLPAAQGAASSVLTNDGSGNLSWGTALTTSLNQFNTFVGNASNVATAVNTNLIGDISASSVSQSYTVTSAAPGVFTVTTAPSTGTKAYVTVTQNGFTANTTYYVTNVSSTTFKLATTLANAVAGTNITSSGTTAGTVISGGFALTSGVKGTVTNDSATSGYVGEYIESVVSTSTNLPANGVAADATTITITAGDWDVSALLEFEGNSSTFAGGFEIDVWIAGASGNSTTGQVRGSNMIVNQSGTTTVPSLLNMTLPLVRVTSNGTDIAIAGTTTSGSQVVRLKASPSGLSAGTPQYRCILRARRVR